jgi:hypothetical protein
MLLLAMDANFKLKNRMRANEIDDPPLGPGWGYFVEPTGYKRHLKTYVPEKDVSDILPNQHHILKKSAGDDLYCVRRSAPEGLAADDWLAHLRRRRRSLCPP